MTAPVLRDVLEPWCAVGATGALRLIEPLEGSVYLREGRIEHVESAVTPGVGKLLTASGRLPLDVWQSAQEQPDGQIGRSLVRSGLLSPLELEAVMTAALLDAAGMVLGLVAAVLFEPGVRCPLGASQAMPLADVCRELDRRRRLLDEAWPDASVDTAVIVPRRRLPGQFVGLTALQWEIATGSNRRRSGVDLAGVLGRDAFSVLLETRRMLQSGLLRAGRQSGSKLSRALLAARERTAIPVVEKAPRVEVSAALPVLPLPRRPLSEMDLPPRPAGEVGAGEVPDELLARLIVGLGALR